MQKKFAFATDSFLIILGVMLLFKPPIDPDFGWHYKYGEWITTRKQIPSENMFSWTMPDHKWADSYWLAQSIFYILGSNFSITGLGLFNALFVSAFLFYFLKRKTYKTHIFIYFSSILCLAYYSISIRPLLFSTLFLLFVVFGLFEKRTIPKWFPIIFLLWANMHADFVLGLFVLFLFTLEQIITKRSARNAVLSLLCVLATLINPYGLGLWQTLLKETHPAQFGFITEWLPKNLSEPTPEAIFFYAVLGGLMATILYQRQKIDAWYFLSTLVFFFFAIRSSYFGRIFFLIALPAFSNLANIIGNNLRPNIIGAKHAGSFLALLFFLTAGQIFFKNLANARDTKIWADNLYPIEAVNYLKKNRISGMLFNDYNYGGFLIWQLPEYKTYIDGRMPSWRDKYYYSVFDEYTLLHVKGFDTKILKEKFPNETLIFITKQEIKNAENPAKNLYIIR